MEREGRDWKRDGKMFPILWRTGFDNGMIQSDQNTLTREDTCSQNDIPYPLCTPDFSVEWAWYETRDTYTSKKRNKQIVILVKKSNFKTLTAL
jgi:hypothetical protein